MDQRFRRVAIFFSGTVLVGAGLFAVACSTDNGETETPLPKADSGVKKDGTTPVVDDDAGTSTPGTDAGTTADADCSKAPKVRDNSTTFFCAFRSEDAGAEDGGTQSGGCNNNEICCNPRSATGQAPFPPSFCTVGVNGDSCSTQAVLNNSTWANGGNAWECADSNNCIAGQVCCLTTGDAGTGNVNIGNSTDTNIPKACGALQAYKLGGTKCAASCAAGTEIKLCGKTDDTCPSGQTCTPFSALFRDLAYCK